MSHINEEHISDRLQNALKELQNPALAKDIWHILREQHFDGFLPEFVVSHLCAKYQMSSEDLALTLLSIVACYANPTISHFSVGAIAKGESGNFYFGANQEFCDNPIAQTIHAEQSSISHAWMRGEKSVTDVFVNYTPCGHCRQFMNELNSASHLKIHLPNQPIQSLHHYLPNAFGPKDLEITNLLMDSEDNHLKHDSKSPIILAALEAANQSHAPYSKTYCGVALQLNNQEIFKGSYAENAAFNPSLPALQVALNLIIMRGYEIENITRAVMIEHPISLSYRRSGKNLLNYLGNVELEYIEV